jgi:hypothetical protein
VNCPYERLFLFDDFDLFICQTVKLVDEVVDLAVGGTLIKLGQAATRYALTGKSTTNF